MFKQERWLSSMEALDLFAGCTRSELRRIARLCTEVRFPVGAVLIREGDPGSEFIVIVEGTAEVRRGGRPVADLGAGDFAGEIALLEGTRRTATVVATSPLSAYILNRSEFASLLRAAPSVASRVLEANRCRVREEPVAA